MKKTLLAVGIAIFAAGTICLAFAALNLFVFGRALDGSAALYTRLHQRAVVSFVIGAVLAAIGAACVIISAKRRPGSRRRRTDDDKNTAQKGS